MSYLLPFMPRTVPPESTHAHFTEKEMWPARKNKMEGWDVSPDLGNPLINPDPLRTRFLHTASQNVSHTHQSPNSLYFSPDPYSNSAHTALTLETNFNSCGLPSQVPEYSSKPSV